MKFPKFSSIPRQVYLHGALGVILIAMSLLVIGVNSCNDGIRHGIEKENSPDLMEYAVQVHLANGKILKYECNSFTNTSCRTYSLFTNRSMTQLIVSFTLAENDKVFITSNK